MGCVRHRYVRQGKVLRPRLLSVPALRCASRFGAPRARIGEPLFPRRCDDDELERRRALLGLRAPPLRRRARFAAMRVLRAADLALTTPVAFAPLPFPPALAALHATARHVLQHRDEFVHLHGVF